MSVKKKYVGNVRDLIVYRKALLFRKIIYKIIKRFPEFEEYNLADTLRKSTCSVVSNISEGNTNFYYNKEYNHLNLALSKVAACRSALDIAEIEGYIDKTRYKSIDAKGEEILKMIIGLMNRIQSKISNEENNLEASSVADKSVSALYHLSTIYDKAVTFNDYILIIVKGYPATELNNMKDQIVRASESILKNLQKSQTTSPNQSFLDVNTALGSISECLSFLDMAVMEGFISRKQYEALNEIGENILDSIIELISHLKQEDGVKVKEVSI